MIPPTGCRCPKRRERTRHDVHPNPRRHHLCVSSGPNDVDLKPFGSNVRMDLDKRFGPLFYCKNGREIGEPSAKTWAAYDAWRKQVNAASDGENGRGK